jgi:oxygen-dependent protoporphyrinogen oxidase
MAREFFHPPHSSTHDESVAEMVERHYGHEMVERVADPLLAGVYGGQAAQLSVRAVLPRFVEMERKYGSLGRAMLAARRRLAAYQQRRPPLFSSMKDGMQQLVDGLLAELDPSALRPGVEVQRVAQSAGRWMVAVAGTEPECFDGLVIATPARAAAALLQDALSPLACELAGIAYSSSLTVSLVYQRTALGHLPPGFGFLVPPNSGKRMLACTFVHNKFPHRAPPDKGLLRVFLGGSRDEAVLDLAEDEILRLVRDELRQVLKLEAEPAAARVYKWRASMAQYGPGHLERLGRMDDCCRQVTGLALAGNGFRGIGVPDCVRSGQEAVQRVLG